MRQAGERLVDGYGQMFGIGNFLKNNKLERKELFIVAFDLFLAFRHSYIDQNWSELGSWEKERKKFTGVKVGNNYLGS